MDATIDPKLISIFSHASQLCQLLARQHPGIDQTELIADAVNHARLVNVGMTSLTSAQSEAMLGAPPVAVAISVARDAAAEFDNSATLMRWANAARQAQPSPPSTARPLQDFDVQREG